MNNEKKEQENSKYFCCLDKEEAVNVGGNYSTVKGPLIQGERMQVSLVHKAAGEVKTSAKLEKTLAS